MFPFQDQIIANVVSSVLVWAGIGLLMIACVYDLGWRLVPNWIPAAIAVAALGLRIVAGEWALGLLAGSGVFVAALLCWRRGWLGGADVKLFGAGAMLVPPSLACGFVLASCLAGGVLALAYLAVGRLTAPPAPHPPRSAPRLALFARLLRIERRRLQRRGPLPYATAIAAGASFVLGGA